jgi:hypothetical protein
MEALDKIDDKLDQVLLSVNTLQVELRQLQKDHWDQEKRLRKIELSIYKAMGLALALGAGSGGAYSWLTG